jgi:nucleotide-binding universal stress UspA family protein
MANTVVVGVDESESAAKAARKAAWLAASVGASLTVVTAFDDEELPAPPADVAPMSVNDIAVQIAQRAIADLRGEFGELEMTARAECGKPAKVLVAVAAEIDASIIVVGNKRVQGLVAVLGSIAHDVAHHAPCDVYIAHTVER